MLKLFKTSILAVIMVLSSQIINAQELLNSLPKTEEDFKKSEPALLATIDWLEKTPFDQEVPKRKEQMMLLMGWVTNSPSVTVEINADILTFTKKYPELLITFFGGWTKYAIQNNYSTDAVKGNYEGLKHVIKVYQNLSLKKDKEIEKLIAMDSKGELESWIKKQLKLE